MDYGNTIEIRPFRDRANGDCFVLNVSIVVGAAESGRAITSWNPLIAEFRDFNESIRFDTISVVADVLFTSTM